MAICEIIQVSLTGGTTIQDKILRTSSNIVDVVDNKTLGVIEDLRDTMWAYPFCVGLSAPQIGKKLTISVVNVTKNNKNDDLILINPLIISTSGKKDKKRESCMSVWGKQGVVERRDKVIVKYFDINFNLKTETFEGFTSRAIQHEIDHLNGIIYSDKLATDQVLSEALFFNDYHILK